MDVIGTKVVMEEIKKVLTSFPKEMSIETIMSQLSVLSNLLILENQIELSKQLDEIERRLPFKSSGLLGPG